MGTGPHRCAPRLLAVGLVVGLAGCSGTAVLHGNSGSSSRGTSIAVIKGWSAALRRGDVAGAARYFALPSTFINGNGPGGLDAFKIRTRREAIAVNESLPCGATFISVERHGRYLDALFRLGSRPGPGGSSCASGAQAIARTNFLIAKGKIVQWLRAPSQPGDNAGPGPAPTLTSPGGTPVV
jgi:hypothetical protein